MTIIPTIPLLATYCHSISGIIIIVIIMIIKVKIIIIIIIIIIIKDC